MHTPKPVTAAEIHQIYGSGALPGSEAAEQPRQSYRKTSFSGREASHPGYPPPRPPGPQKNRRP